MGYHIVEVVVQLVYKESTINKLPTSQTVKHIRAEGADVVKNMLMTPSSPP